MYWECQFIYVKFSRTSAALPEAQRWNHHQTKDTRTQSDVPFSPWHLIIYCDLPSINITTHGVYIWWPLCVVYYIRSVPYHIANGLPIGFLLMRIDGEFQVLGLHECWIVNEYGWVVCSHCACFRCIHGMCMFSVCMYKTQCCRVVVQVGWTSCAVSITTVYGSLFRHSFTIIWLVMKHFDSMSYIDIVHHASVMYHQCNQSPQCSNCELRLVLWWK